ncbi:MAG: Dabb family protein [Acidobacteria bacterium]|nr:Dabb family protein [Acidobacteriota bacterium]
MLTHIVCWKYKPDATVEERQRHIAALKALKGVIPEIVSLDAGADILHLDRSFDTGLVAVFADRAALDRYSTHAEHLKVIDMGRELTERAVSVDFISE